MRQLHILLISAALAAGCGGGGGASLSSGGGSGSAGLLRFEGKVKTPLVATTPGATAYGLYGDITTATIAHTSPTADESEIVFSHYGPNGYSIAAINPDGTGLRTVVSGMTGPATHLRVTLDDKYVYYIRAGNLQRVPLAGGLPSTLIAGVSSFALTPSAQKVVYRKTGTEEIWMANHNGTSPAMLRNFPNFNMVVIACPKETVGWLRANNNLNFQYTFELVVNGALGNADARLAPHVWQSYDHVTQSSTFEANNSGNYDHFTFFFLGNRIKGFQDEGTAPTGTVDGALEPGGQRLAVIRDGGGFGSTALDLAYLNGTKISKVFQSGGSMMYACAWTPYRPIRPVIGAGTAWPTGVGALMLSQIGQGVRGVAIADGTSNTILVNETQNGVGNAVYNVTNDGVLTKLYTAYGHCTVWTPIVNGNTGLKGALVSFDYQTGRVGSIVTYTKKPNLVREPGGIRLEGGEVVDVFDGSGVRRRTAGASIRL